MARKESIRRQDILNAAFEILQESGIEQVTARKLAAKAGCSTQPIFRLYKNMEELTGELFSMAYDFFQEYYEKARKEAETPFVHLGNVYIRFARQHKKLFAFLFLSKDKFGKSRYDLVNGSAGNVSREIKSSEAQGCQDAEELFVKMWILIHGAACMSLTEDYDLSEEETVKMLEDSYQAFQQ